MAEQLSVCYKHMTCYHRLALTHAVRQLLYFTCMMVHRLASPQAYSNLTDNLHFSSVVKYSLVTYQYSFLSPEHIEEVASFWLYLAFR